jgi:hypothetical protein
MAIKTAAQYEDEIVAKLLPTLSLINVQVAPMPNTRATLEKAIDDPRIYVAYNSTDFGKSRSSSSMIQDGTVAFEILIQGPKLRASPGIYDVLTVCQLLLTGLLIEELTKLEFKTEEMLSYDSHGNWNWRQVFQGVRNNVQADDGELDIILTRIQNEITALNGIDDAPVPVAEQ